MLRLSEQKMRAQTFTDNVCVVEIRIHLILVTLSFILRHAVDHCAAHAHRHQNPREWETRHFTRKKKKKTTEEKKKTATSSDRLSGFCGTHCRAAGAQGWGDCSAEFIKAGRAHVIQPAGKQEEGASGSSSVVAADTPFCREQRITPVANELGCTSSVLVQKTTTTKNKKSMEKRKERSIPYENHFFPRGSREL